VTLVAVTDRELNAEIDPQAEKESRDRDGDDVEPSDHEKAGADRHHQAGRSRHEHGEDKPTGS
jgi:hypothetical protein